MRSATTWRNRRLSRGNQPRTARRVGDLGRDMKPSSEVTRWSTANCQVGRREARKIPKPWISTNRRRRKIPGAGRRCATDFSSAMTRW